MSDAEQETLALVDVVIRTGSLRPVITLLHGTTGGEDRARDALTVLGELDLDVLVQLALTTLAEGRVDGGGRRSNDSTDAG